jgi:hypothetical protein
MHDRRTLDFGSLDEVLAEVDRLLAGHRTVGRWTLGQILYHLATAIRVTCRGRPVPEARPVSDEVRERFFRLRRFPEGLEAPHPRLVPPVDADARTEAEALRQAIARWAAAPGPFSAHPLLGPMNKVEWTQFHCIHCAHHLGFAIPA